jgi:cob(I)alamin adenosyltransferase
MFQFIKAKTANWGETRAARRMGFELVALGSGFTWQSQDIEQDRSLAREGWERCRAAGGPGHRPGDPGRANLLLQVRLAGSGRRAGDAKPAAIAPARRDHRPRPPQALIDFADTVSEIQPVKHAYQAGIKPQRGIEF